MWNRLWDDRFRIKFVSNKFSLSGLWKRFFDRQKRRYETHHRTPARKECRSWSAWRWTRCRCWSHHRWRTEFRWCQSTFWFLNQVLKRVSSCEQVLSCDQVGSFGFQAKQFGLNNIEHRLEETIQVLDQFDIADLADFFLILSTIFQFFN